MKVAICDDEKVCLARVLDFASDYSEARLDREIEFVPFGSSEELLESVQAGSEFDIFLLDIVMPFMNGIALGRALREMGEEGKIIYLTSSEEYALDSFRVRAFDYLLKPIEKDAFDKVMDEAINSLQIKKEKGVIIKTREGTARIVFDSILYVELSKRSVLYHLADGKTVESTTLRGSFSEAMTELVEDSRFVLCGASTVLNLHHVTAVENESVLFSGGEKVFLSKKLCRPLRSEWNSYWITKGG